MMRRIPAPLPEGLLADLARRRGLLLCLDYDGTIAEIVVEPMDARPYHGIDSTLRRLAQARRNMRSAIVTGRRVFEVKALLGAVPELLFSGVHGLEFDTTDANSRFAPEALACADHLMLARRWLHHNVPQGRGFRIEDKEIALALHYRLAEPRETSILSRRLEDFVNKDLERLKLMHLKMVVEVIPAIASKAHAVAELKRLTPSDWVTVYLGDDETDEDAFAVMDQSDLGILVGPMRMSFAGYRLENPAMVARELSSLADAII